MSLLRRLWLRILRTPRRSPSPAALLALVVLSHAVLAADAVPARPPGAASEIMPREIEALLLKIELQISMGHTLLPVDDNALTTWDGVVELQRSAPGSPEVSKVLQSFAARIRSRAASERTAGRPLVASDFAIFGEMVTEMLASPGVSPQDAGPPAAPPAVVARQAVAEPAAPGPGAPKQGAVPAPPAPAQPAALSAGDAAPGPRAGAPGVALRADTPGASGRPTNGTAGTAAAPSPVATALALSVLGTARPSAGAPPPQEEAQVTLYMQRGDAMLAAKDISAARKFYEYAFKAGSARAALAIAKTYDPASFGRLGIVGLRPDQGLAATWYRRAALLGNPDAEAWLRVLSTEAAR